MQVLVIDSTSGDPAIMRSLQRRGLEVRLISDVIAAVDLASQTAFDCILVDVSAAGQSLGLAEIRRLVKTSSVVLMTTSSVETLVMEAVAEGSIEFRPLPVTESTLEDLSQPVLLVAPYFDPVAMDAVRDKGLRASAANTLQFAMNLLVDGWCQIVCLNANIPRPIQRDEVAIVREVTTKHLAILASAVSDAGITQCPKPQTEDEFRAIIKAAGGSRTEYCGLAEHFGMPNRTVQ